MNDAVINKQPTLAQAKQYLNQLDLDYICQKMCSAHYTLPRWNYAQAQQCAKHYKQFLWLLIKYPKHHHVPTKTIDEFWHNHILYTQFYIRDCLALKGQYIHHTPANPDHDDMAKLAEQFATTKALWLKEFGEPLMVFYDIHN